MKISTTSNTQGFSQRHWQNSVVRRATTLLLGWMILFGGGLDLAAQQSATVPTEHWAYEYARQLALRHRQAAVFLDVLPYSAGEFAAFADTFRAPSFSGAEQFWLQRLQAMAVPPVANTSWLQAGGRLQEQVGKFGEAPHARGALRTLVGLFPDRHVSFVNAIRLDQELRDDPAYLGKRWRGFAGFTEQAYVSLHFGKYLVKFGRDFLRWGRGYDATLLVSDASRPLDQFYAGVSLKHLRFYYVAAKLNPTALEDSLRAFYRRDFAERYFSAVRVEWLPDPELLKLAVTQMVLYGGPDRGFEWYYLNPLALFHGEQVNEARKGNTSLAFDWVLRPRDRMELYGQFFLDDHQIEQTRIDDREPTEFGVLIGGVWADPLQLPGTTLGLEYTRVANRTYNSLATWERFTHRNRPLAHFLGNDFERWLLHGQMYTGSNVQLLFSFESRRRGEGRLDSAFTTPWRDLPAGEAFREAFPSGIVERSTHVDLEARWHPHRDFYLSLAAGHSRYRDFEHQSGVDQDETRVWLRLWLEKFLWLGLD
ncbi:MAG: capsule assembly Wzi family protein [bacterium]